MNAEQPSDPTDRRQQIDALIEEFASDQISQKQAWLATHGSVPRRLHHYTTITGLQGIATSTSIWASDARFLNDSSELTWAASLIDDVVREVFNEEPKGPLADALPNYEGLLNVFQYGSRPFVACFCEDGDLLSQWRGYGTGEAPASLGFDLTQLARFGLPPRTYLRRVIYDGETQRQLVRSITETWLATVRRLLTGASQYQIDDILPYPAIWALQEALAEPHLCFKNPAFAEEREWRLIKVVDVREEFSLLNDRRTEQRIAETWARAAANGATIPPDPPTISRASTAEGIDIQFRTSNLGIVPYVELPLRDFAGVFTGLLPLWEVVQGPTTHPEVSIQSLSMFLECRGYGFHTAVRPSHIPLRT